MIDIEIKQNPNREGGIVFRLADGAEALRFNPDGSVFVRGEQVDDNRAIYEEFEAWLSKSQVREDR